MFSNKVLLITGGTGSFGNTIVRRFIDTDIKKIIVFSRDEKKQEDMRISLANPKIQFVIGDVRDPHSLRQAMLGVDYVFHAAALKQVPSCEFYPMEATLTNVVGTENVLNSAIDRGVSRVVLLSTDKAVYPVNAMGISKALAEKLLVAKSRNFAEGQGPILCATRYGNVMGSRGSVIPLFINQIQSGKPITVTDPSMTRFLMSLAQSVDLVLHAFAHGVGGDIFVQKAPACTVLDLALALKELLGGKSSIEVIGARHGEKKYETLISREENAQAKDMGLFVRIPADHRKLNYRTELFNHDLKANLAEDYTSDNTTQLSVEEIKNLLLEVDEVRTLLR